MFGLPAGNSLESPPPGSLSITQLTELGKAYVIITERPGLPTVIVPPAFAKHCAII